MAIAEVLKKSLSSNPIMVGGTIVVELMSCWETVVIPIEKDSIMKTSYVSIGSATPGITFATKRCMTHMLEVVKLW